MRTVLRILEEPAFVDDGVVPSEGLEVGGEDFDVGAELLLGDGEAVGVPTIPAHRRCRGDDCFRRYLRPHGLTCKDRHQKKTRTPDFHCNSRPFALAKTSRFHDTAKTARWGAGTTANLYKKGLSTRIPAIFWPALISSERMTFAPDFKADAHINASQKLIRDSSSIRNAAATSAAVVST